MNIKKLFVCISIFFLIAGCSKSDDSNEKGYFSSLLMSVGSIFSGDSNEKKDSSTQSLISAVDQQKYPAWNNMSNESIMDKDGYYGLIRVFSRHYLKGNNNKGEQANVDFVVHGAGGLISIGNRLYVVTAKHVIIPNTEIKKVKLSEKSDPIEFKNISTIESQILIGGFGVQPKSVMVSENEDFCILLLSDQDRNIILKSYNKDRYAPLSIINENPIENPSGMTAEVWGFPAQHNPQVERVLVSASAKKFFSLNKALLRGYSGGPVFILNDETKQKEFAGIIIRADEKANQSIVLPITSFSHVLEAIKMSKKSSDIVYINEGNEKSLGAVKYRYINYI